jgi:predicted RNA binding protein YcfA (HicA-like mRNA interferase family)
MSKADKLIEKLKRGTISADELITLLSKLGWVQDRVRGSHQVWAKENKTLVLALHGKDLKRYQIKEAQAALEVESES